MDVAVKAAGRANVEARPVPMIKKVGIIGAGQMGTGIAHVVALGGYEVHLYDIKKEAIEKSLAATEKNMSRQVSRGLIKDADMKAALKRIKVAPNLDAFRECDLVIEAATEEEEIKRRIFAELCPRLKKDSLVATNTSSISITRLASTTDRPEHFIGMHFMNPVPLMELVELIRGIATEDDMFAIARAFVESLGKVPAVAEDFPAFIVNRILLPMINEAVYTLYEGLSDSKYRPCPLLVKYVEAGWLGRKTQRGFYDYRGEKPVPTR